MSILGLSDGAWCAQDAAHDALSLVRTFIRQRVALPLCLPALILVIYNKPDLAWGAHHQHLGELIYRISNLALARSGPETDHTSLNDFDRFGHGPPTH